MENVTLRVEDNMVVSLAYNLIVKDEQVVLREEKRASKQIMQGRHQVIRGLEKALYGMSVGEEKDVVVNAPKEFGKVDPSAVKTLRRQSVPSFATAVPGQKLRLVHKGSGELQRAIVVEVQPDTIVLDFNHPFAEKTLYYTVRVDDLRPATPEELETGKIQ